MTTTATGLGSTAIVAPAILWSVHFLFVYIFVSLACLWGWDEASIVGIDAVRFVIGAVTVAVIVAILVIGFFAWRMEQHLRPAMNQGDAVAKRRYFCSVATAVQSVFFAFATLMVGMPTLLRPPCY